EFPRCICVNPRRIFLLLPQKTAELRSAELISRKHRLHVRRAQMLLRDLSEHITKVGCQREVTAFVQLIVLKTRPVAVNFSAAHSVAYDEHRIRVPVVGAAIAVLFPCASEFSPR